MFANLMYSTSHRDETAMPQLRLSLWLEVGLSVVARVRLPLEATPDSVSSCGFARNFDLAAPHSRRPKFFGAPSASFSPQPPRRIAQQTFQIASKRPNDNMADVKKAQDEDMDYTIEPEANATGPDTSDWPLLLKNWDKRTSAHPVMIVGRS